LPLLYLCYIAMIRIHNDKVQACTCMWESKDDKNREMRQSFKNIVKMRNEAVFQEYCTIFLKDCLISLFLSSCYDKFCRKPNTGVSVWWTSRLLSAIHFIGYWLRVFTPTFGETYRWFVSCYECDPFISLTDICIAKAQSRAFRLLWTRHFVVDT
jgi:hypothetical protein